ncbi:MAG TPA: putative LPS assembly protein LptD, partial [Longimicrobium sp.]
VSLLRAGVLAALVLGAVPAAAQVRGLPRPPTRGAPTPQRPRVLGDTVPRPAGRDTAARDTARPRREVPADTLVDRLMELSGYVPVEYAGDSAEFSGDTRILRLRGDPSVKREGRELVARDSIVYQERSDIVAAYGEPRATGEGEPLSGDVMLYNLESGRASVRGARTTVTENGTWLVEGDVTSTRRGERIYAAASTFTSDDRPEPAYYFKADRIMVVRNRLLVGRPAYLYFRNVPVMALPFIVQDLERGRRSGFLIPNFELNDIVRTHSAGGSQRGTGREVSNLGYYWAINQYMGAAFSGGWRSGTYTNVAADLDFRWRRRFLNGSFRTVRYAQEEGPTQYTISGSGRWEVNERTDLTAALDYATSTRFERNRTVDPFRQTQDLRSSGAITRELDWGSFSLSADRRQSLGNDDRTLSPNFNLNVDPVTFLRTPAGGNPRWYNDATLTFGLNGSGSRFTPGDSVSRRPQTDQFSLASSPSIQFGNLALSTSLAYRLDGTGRLSAFDTVGIPIDQRPTGTIDAVGGRQREAVSFSASTGYQIPLIASTRITPSISFTQEVVRADTLIEAGDTIAGPALADSLSDVYGTFVGGPPRVNFGATLATDLYGFFPGVAGTSAIRHHLKPSFSYQYSPQATTDNDPRNRVRRILFGQSVGRTTNVVTIGLDQTFEAKLRDPRPVRGDSLADSARSAGNRAEPQEPRKITILSINTSAISYSFAPTDTLVGRFQNDIVTNSIRSDLLGGLQFTTSHDLFADEQRGSRVQRGPFSPYLTSLNTSFSLGANSALFRWLGFGGRPEQERTPAEQRGQVSDSVGTQPVVPLGNSAFTGNTQRTGQGTWNVQMGYSLARTRRATGDVTPGRFERGDQSLTGNVAFFPTRNWAVTWSTAYSITSGDFDAHSLHFKRDLYRWEANFDFYRTPNGNTSFGFRVHLMDLPDLKADYRESDLGIDRPQTTPNGVRTVPR